MPKNVNIEFPLSQLAGGAIQEKVDHELVKIFNNIHDPNTNPEDKRTITIKIDLKPDDMRQTVKVTSNISIKLANVKDISSTVLTGKDIGTGRIEARELKSNVPGQTYFDNNAEIRTDIGEPIDVVEKEENRKKIINLQKGRG